MLQSSGLSRQFSQRQCQAMSAMSALRQIHSCQAKPFVSLPNLIRTSQRLSSRGISSSSVKHAAEVAMPKLKLDEAFSPFMGNMKSSAQPEPKLDEFWRKIPMWKDVSAEQFMSYSWSVSATHARNAVEEAVADLNLDEK